MYRKTIVRRLYFSLFYILVCFASAKQIDIVQKNDSLCNAFKDYFLIGAAISPEADLSSQERKLFISKHYNSVTAENQMKPKQIHPKDEVWNWKPADDVVSFARANKMKVRGHTLVWQQNTPSWLIKQNGQLASKEYMYAKMKQHITAVMHRYKNVVYCWDVVNEAISDQPNEVFRSKDTLYTIAGEEYVEMAFRFAKEADPGAQLYYNDYRFSNPIKRQKVYNLLKKLVDKKVPIDGVGIQSHYVPGEITKEYLQETIDMFSKLGLKIQVTELDVSVYNYRDKNNPDTDVTDDRYTEERRKRQEETYAMLFELYRKNKDMITGVTFWGSSDMRKNFRTNRIGKMDYPFLFDENMHPKQAFFRVVNF